MIDKWTLNSLATYLVDNPAVSVPIAHSLNFLVWPFIVPSTRCTCVMIKLFNQLLDMPHVSGGWIILAKRNKLFLRMEHFWDLLFQLVKHGTNTLSLFLFSVTDGIHKLHIPCQMRTPNGLVD